jgi:hypothetical protein
MSYDRATFRQLAEELKNDSGKLGFYWLAVKHQERTIWQDMRSSVP